MSLELLKNKGVVVARPATNQQQKTFVVVGVARGGTSIVAGALYHLGIPMGNASAPVFEDLRLSLAFEKQSKEKFEQVVAEYNQRHDVWGWKRPSTLHALARIARKVRNPHFIFVFRDMLSVANRNTISMHMGVESGLLGAVEDYRKIVKFIEKSKQPALLVSSEKVVKHKTPFIDALADFCGVEATQLQVDAAMQFLSPDPKAYLNKTRVTESKGAIDESALKAGILKGWAYYSLHQREAIVEVRVNGDLVASQAANLQVDAYKQSAKHPTGQCGFEIDLKVLGAHPSDKIEIKVKDDVVPLTMEPSILRDLLDWGTEVEPMDLVNPMGKINYPLLQTGLLKGWARTELASKPALIGIYINGCEFARVPASIYREHLKRDKAHPTGCCGYEFDLKAHGVRPSDRIEVRLENADCDIHLEPICFPHLEEWLSQSDLNAVQHKQVAQG
ncbi:hypothetical protein GT360_13515 [Vibrio astriarenae]|uniref:Sulfotransferase family protein n=1 Tax=Vibrio astriarenae TaxID=1481923 RepID=A0A7Z2YET8_9VIBR|nr:hypothetical protein [Vibrio astriarenae]QIA64445.1 hypothetical protein GT360_13515 [Vibrio astriarenae]